jgi:hypothetical protein
VWFEFGNNPNTNLNFSFKTKSYSQSPKPLTGSVCPKARCGSIFLDGLATQQAAPAHRPHPLTSSLLLSLTGRAHASATSLPLLLLPYPLPASDAAHQATRAATARARDGTRASTSGPARRGTGACMRTDPTRLGAGISLLPPFTSRPCSLSGARKASAASAARPV